MTERMLQLIREYRAGIINRRSFCYGWKKQLDILGGNHEEGI